MNRIISNKMPFSSQVTAYTRRGRHRPPLSLSVGDKITDFQLLHSKYYKDFDLTHLHFHSHQNQTNIHQLECSEENNTLSMIFKTKNVPKPGINYALEKLLQCGSKKYPVGNLPYEMSRRSFSLLSQPQTTDDYLMFSFNSPILKDFSNLFQVYCSMLFDPLMREEDFYEAVRRLTYEDRSLGFTGELASQLNSNQFQLDTAIYTIINEALLGERHQALCKPIDLLNISFRDVLKYYNETITLPNCTIVLHGDANIHYLIDQFQKNVEQFKPNTHSPTFYDLSPLAKSEKKTLHFQHLRQQTLLMMSYEIKDATDEELTLLSILSYLLFDMPESPFLKFNSPETPYPNLYGFQQRYFNVGITFFEPQYPEEKHMMSAETFRQREKFLLQKQKQVRSTLQDIADNKFNDKLIQKCLLHLENNYYSSNGIQLIESIVEKIINKGKLDSTFEVTSLISKLLKTHRKNNIFESVLKKFILDNPNYIVLRGVNNPDIIEFENNRNRSLLAHMQFSLPGPQLTQIANYSSPNLLQDFSRLSAISPNQLEFFEDINGQDIKIGDVKTVYSPRHQGNRFIFKFDLTDVGQDDIPLLSLFCKAFPEMGYKSIKESAYHALLQTYLSKLEMSYQCVKAQKGQLKIQLYLTVQFTDRNYDFAFNILSGLLTEFNPSNLSALSRVMHRSSSESYNLLSEDILHYHGLHLAASKSPFVFFESPIFQARTLCGLAAEMKKVHNPKGYLLSISSKMHQIWEKMVGWSRMELLWECHPDKKTHYFKHLKMLLAQIKTEGIPPAGIDISGFPRQKWQKYYPNYQNQLIFQTFSMPYRQPNSPEALVLSSIINQNIVTFNQTGGCFLYKGALVSFIAGTRRKFLELEDYYKKIEDLDVAKRKIFQKFDRYTVEHQFKSGVSFAQARSFKQAVLSVQKDQVEAILNDYILKEVKAGNSSVLCLGGRLENYEPLMKKGWQIQRSIDDLSLNMQSLSKQEIRYELKRYVDIC